MTLNRNILIACEYGYGQRHLHRLLRIYDLYTLSQYKVFMYYYDMGSSKPYQSQTIRNYLINPTPLGNPLIQNHSIVSYGDVLRMFHVNDKEKLKSYFERWIKIFKELKPLLVICENAPLLGLIASSEAKTISIGDGVSMLPFVEYDFPVLRTDKPNNLNGRKALANINWGLKSLQISPINKLGDIWAELVSIVTHVPQLDLYHHYRSQKQIYYCRHSTNKNNSLTRDKRIFMYLHPDYQNFDAILIAVVEQKFFGKALIPGANEKVMNFLETHGIEVFQDFNLTYKFHVEDVNLIIHHGGIETAEYGLINGIPQILFPKSLNSFFVARFLENTQQGLVINNKWLGIKQIGDLVCSYWEKATYPKRQCQKIGPKTLNLKEFENRMLEFAQKQS